MPLPIRKLVFFEKWIDPIAETLIAQADGIEVVRLTYDAPTEANWRIMAEAHGYQIAPGAELKEPWFGTGTAGRLPEPACDLHARRRL